MNNLKTLIGSLLRSLVSAVISLSILLNCQPVHAQSLSSHFLSEADESAVLAWITNETEAVKAPYCYRQSYGRGVGAIPTEAGSNRVIIGALSYSQCPANTMRVGFDCHSVCPSGMRDDGLFCRRSEYGRGAGYVKRSICERNAGQWGTSECEKYGLLFYPKCRPGYNAFGANICRPSRPDCNALGLAGGFDLSCAKKVIVGDPKPLLCSSGKENDAGLCYPTCREGYGGVGPVCWQQCNPGTFSCGAGCTIDQSSCVNNTLDQVLSPVQLALNAISFGAANSSGKLATSLKKAEDLLQPLSDALEIYGQQENAALPTDLITTFNNTLNEFIDAYTVNMEALTTSNVVKTLNEKFTPAQYNQIARQYAQLQFQVIANKLNIDLLKQFTDLDPTGISSVVAAYAHPICTRNQPFPNITTLKA